MTYYLLALLVFTVAFIAGAHFGGPLLLEPPTRPDVIVPDDQADADADFRRALAALDAA